MEIGRNRQREIERNRQREGWKRDRQKEKEKDGPVVRTYLWLLALQSTDIFSVPGGSRTRQPATRQGCGSGISLSGVDHRTGF